MKQDPIDAILKKYETEGKYPPEVISNFRRMLKSRGEDTLAQGVAGLYEQHVGVDDKYTTFVDRAQTQGYWFISEANIKEAGDDLRSIIEKTGINDHKEYTAVLNELDTTADADLYAAFVLNIPEIREHVKSTIGEYGNLYRVVQKILRDRKKKKDKGPKQYKDETETKTKTVIPKSGIENIVTRGVTSRTTGDKSTSRGEKQNYKSITEQLPEGLFSILNKDEAELSSNEKNQFEDSKRLFMILREKAQRDVMREFNLSDNPHDALPRLEAYVGEQTNSNLEYLYQDQLRQFRDYVGFHDRIVASSHVNKKFIHPGTGKTGVLPSIHQTIAQHHNLKEGRFGVFDDCGTGKTYIAALMKPLIEAKLRTEGKKVTGRTLVIGPKTSTKAWRDGLCGDDEKRYFTNRQKVAWVNGAKNDEFHKEMEESDFIFVNFEQLCLDYTVGGETKKVYEVLAELGFDQLIIDEVHEARNISAVTKSGKPTESYAVRRLATNDGLEYITALSGTPMPDNLDDYANIFFMLKPEYFVEEIEGRSQFNFANIGKRFKEIYEGDPRALYSFVKQNTIRRRSCDVSNLPPHRTIIDETELTDVQIEISDYIFDKTPKNWLTQLRYATLDPRLVSPQILKELGLIGKISRADSAKYTRLEEELCSADGPIAKGDKFLVFSSMFAEGVTREAEKLKSKYRKMGYADEFDRMNIRPLNVELEEVLSAHFGRDVEVTSIDANTKDADRENAVDRLSNGLEGVACTALSGGVSLNFSKTNWQYWLDQHYSPYVTDQGIARSSRKGQSKETTATFLFGKECVDQAVHALNLQKSENIQMALDGVELTEKERDILSGDNDGLRLKELLLRGKGGFSIDMSYVEIGDVEDFLTKRVVKRKKSGTNRILSSEVYEATVGQEIREAIMRNPVNIWHDGEFVKKYCGNFESLSPYLLGRAKVADMVRRGMTGEIEFPKILLADAAAQGILYTAFEELEELVKSAGFEMPLIYDRDFSSEMSLRSPNPEKVVGDMCGERGIFDAEFLARQGKFNFIDNSSITLLENRERLCDYMMEANRLLTPEGYLQLGVGGWAFSKEFFEGMKRSGFETVVKSHRHAVSKDKFRFLKQEFGQHFAEAYRSKLQSSTFSIFQKVETVEEVDSKYFLLENPNFDNSLEVKEENVVEVNQGVNTKGKDPKGEDVRIEDENIVRPAKSRAGSFSGKGASAKPRREYTGSRRLVVGPDGVVSSAE